MTPHKIGTEDLERCAFCGLNVETPCDAPPPVICSQAHEILLSQQAEMDAERKLFEDAMFQHYLNQFAAGKLDMTQAGDGTPEALFWKQPNGEYGVLMFNAAWYGWRAAKGLV
jgi:hypothetical protein